MSDPLERAAGSNHAVLMNNGVLLICGRVQAVSHQDFLKLHPVEANAPRNFQTLGKLRTQQKHNRIVFVTVEGDTIDVRSSNVSIIEDSTP